MFIGRENELKLLKSRFLKRSSSFVVIRGRRRIGKSRLIKEFSKDFSKKFLFTAIPPTQKITPKIQKEEFVKQMKKQGLPAVSSDDWTDIFWVLGKACDRGSSLIALDEISWMGSKDQAFLGKLKIAWDQYFSDNPKLILIVASSISSWIDKNILNSTGFFGRIDLTLTLRELPIKDCCKFWGKREKSTSSYEKLKILGVTGGIPRYLEEINPKKTAEENIQELCFSDSGLLFNEFDRIFHDLFARRSALYKKIVEVLVETSSMNQEDICKKINKKRGRAISEYLSDLVTAGFLAEDNPWSLKTHKVSKLKKYRLSDNYLRFYLKYIAPKKKKISQGKPQGKLGEVSLFSSMSWESIMGLQFENFVIHNHKILFEALNISPSNTFYDGPFFQTKTKRRKGCQIDYLIQTKSTLYICEIKFSQHPIGKQLIEEMQKKIDALLIPKHISYRCVLIHVGGVTQELREEGYFDHLIDWTKVLESD